jgi:hypothetical protein
MFQRVQIGSWHGVLTAALLVLFFLLFMLIVVRACRMPKERRRHLESLPLEDEKHDHDEPAP